MRKRDQPPNSGYQFHGRTYSTAAEYQAALAKWHERRHRLLDAINREQDNDRA
jgi:hypothetical protein